jgi:hypothetical protein
MGQSYGAICNACGCRFEAREGGGFFFHMLHCDKCGKEKTIPFDQLGDAHLRYVKGLPGPYSEATRALDEYVRENYPDPPISEAEYHAFVEKTVGKHSCGGHFRLNARARCPKCGADDLRKDPRVPIDSYD